MNRTHWIVEVYGAGGGGLPGIREARETFAEAEALAAQFKARFSSAARIIIVPCRCHNGWH